MFLLCALAFSLQLVQVVVVGAHQVPICGGTFCADTKEIMYINGTVASSQTYNLCMDTAALNWKRTQPDGSFTMVNTAANEGLGWYYTVNVRGECTKSVPQSPADASQLPFTFVKIDSTAHREGSAKSPDSQITSATWEHKRQSKKSGGVTYPAEDMMWYVHTVNGDDVLVESTCGQSYDVTPGDGGHSTTQSGNRDFSTNFDAQTGEMKETYAEPDGCTTSNDRVLLASAFTALF